VITHLSPASKGTSATAWPSRLLLAEMLKLLMRLHRPLLGLLAALGFTAALSPAFAWLSKQVVQRVEAGETDPWALLPEFLPLFVLISAGLFIAEFGQKMLSNVMEFRLVIALQRSYLERRQLANVPQDVAHVLYGSDVAKKGFQVIYQDAWKIVTVTASVLIWQLSIGPEWIPLLLASIVPTALFVWFFGARIQRGSREILDLQSKITEATGNEQRSHLHAHQERLFRVNLRFHVLKWLAEDASDVVMWLAFAASVAAVYWLHIGNSVRDISLAELSALVVNLRLLVKPLGDIGRVYTRWREAYPALQRSLTPEDAAVGA
jgi:ABC-type multidrug transport system fused ATPase/permease subunit